MITFQAVQSDNAVVITKCDNGLTYELTTSKWREAVEWITADKTDLAVCLHLDDFTRALFSLLPDADREKAEKAERVYADNCKIFYVSGRYLGLTVSFYEGNFTRKAETNIQALSWWLDENNPEPKNVKELYDLAQGIITALDKMGIKPKKLTSPVGVFCDTLTGKYPTVWTFPEDKLECFDYAAECMRFEWRSAYQVGYFNETHLYDLVSAYPAAIAQLPSTDNCQCAFAQVKPQWAQWGIMKGTVKITADISPLVYGEERICPKGEWQGYFTTGEIRFIEKWQLGTFKLDEGWWFAFGKDRPYKKDIDLLFNFKNQKEDKTLSLIAKKMMQGISGKLDEDRADGSKGDFYNPILACMVRSYCRLQVAEFIYQNKLQDDLIAVLVDSVLSTKPVTLTETAQIGSWRYEGQSEAIVLSKGGIWRPGKRPQGISYEDLLKALRDQPDKAYYEFKTESGTVRSIDLLLNDADRVFDYPQSGGEVLNRISKSTAIEVQNGN